VKPILLVVGFVVIMASISGCASVATQTDILCEGPLADGPVVEVPTAVNPTPGMVGMIIKATIKTHPEGFYLLEPESHMHGKTGFPFVVVIDNKTFEWHDDGRREVLPFCDENGDPMPEGGEGIRYTVERELLLNPGPHRVTLKLPSEKKNITVPLEPVADHAPHILEFKPVYHGPNTRRFGFLYGVVDMHAFSDGAQLQKCGN
jgi:hypothetical protein